MQHKKKSLQKVGKNLSIKHKIAKVRQQYGVREITGSSQLRVFNFYKRILDEKSCSKHYNNRR
jgi:hypothetical protein